MAKRKRKAKLTARTAEKYILYSDAVQTPELEIDFFKRIYQKRNSRPPTIMREDFCGTSAICCAWARLGSNHRAIGVDLDPEPLRWGREHYLSTLTPEQVRRVELRRANVLTVKTGPVDVILALNFSFCVFKQRTVLLRYLRRCRQALARGGMMVMDIYGGPEAQQVMQEETRKKGYTYVWDQARYNPITGEALNHIHFHFPDGSRMSRAFTYDWRLWTLTELCDTLIEAGFGETRVYWEDSDADGEGTGVYRHRTKAPADDAWIAYVVGLR